MAYEQSNVRTKQYNITRDGKLALRDATPPFRPLTTGLKYLGRTDGYGCDLTFTFDDPFVREAMKDLFGSLPKELKGYTRSGATMERLYVALAKYDVDHPRYTPRGKEWQEAVRLTHAAFRLPDRVEPKVLDDVSYQSNTSAGWSFLGSKKGEVYEEALGEAHAIKRLVGQNSLSKGALPPCVAFKRTQLAEIQSPKVRMVWGYPFEMTLLEGQYAQPLIEEYAKFDGPMFTGRTVLKELPVFIDSVFLFGRGVAIDWSGFDSTVSEALIRVAFDVVFENLALSDHQKRELRMLQKYFVKTPIVMPDGHVFIKYGGVPSGSHFTQLVDSIINFLVIMYLAILHFDGKRPYKVKVLGDDSIFSLRPGLEMSFESWAARAWKEFGMTLNVKKSMVASTPREIEFLGHSARAGRVIRDDVKLLRLALYPEYATRDPETAVSRVLGLLIDSGFQSWPIYLLYTYMIGRWKVGRTLTSKWMMYVIQRELPPDTMSDSRVFAVS